MLSFTQGKTSLNTHKKKEKNYTNHINIEIMANQNASTPASAGKSTITSFRYYKGFCIVSLSNGVSGIIGNAIEMPLSTMLTLKGQEISYEHVGMYNDTPKYRLEFAL